MNDIERAIALIRRNPSVLRDFVRPSVNDIVRVYLRTNERKYG